MTNLTKAKTIKRLKKAVKILIGDNAKRCQYISRRDNNDLWYMGENVEQIIKRIERDYD